MVQKNTFMDKLKGWLLEQMKVEELKGQTPQFWRLKDWLTRVSMAEFESTRLSRTTTGRKQEIYEELVAPIKEEIKFWNK